MSDQISRLILGQAADDARACIAIGLKGDDGDIFGWTSIDCLLNQPVEVITADAVGNLLAGGDIPLGMGVNVGDPPGPGLQNTFPMADRGGDGPGCLQMAQVIGPIEQVERPVSHLVVGEVIRL